MGGGLGESEVWVQWSIKGTGGLEQVIKHLCFLEWKRRIVDVLVFSLSCGGDDMK